MANFFKNPLVLAETVVGSIVDTRPLVFYKQPENIDFSKITDDVGNEIQKLVDRRALEELFTGIDVPILSKINGFNMYGISYVQGEVKIESDLCDHPTETGSVVTDYAIVQPISMRIQIAMPTALYTRIYTQMIKCYQDKTFILVQTKFAMYRNMVIEAMPYKLENSTVDRPIIELSLRQIMEVTPRYINISNEQGINNAADGSDNDTVDVGNMMTETIDKVFTK